MEIEANDARGILSARNARRARHSHHHHHQYVIPNQIQLVSIRMLIFL